MPSRDGRQRHLRPLRRRAYRSASRTTCPPCTTTICADSKSTSLMRAVQLSLGQPAARAEIGPGPGVVTQNDTLPFLISVERIVVLTLAANGTLFCPGDSFPPGLMQVVSPLPVTLTVIVRSWFPRPARDAQSVSVVPLSRTEGSRLK